MLISPGWTRNFLTAKKAGKILNPENPGWLAKDEPGSLLNLPDNSADLEKTLLRYTTYIVLPMWFGPALLDYVMHRRTDIEHTSGARESVLHNLMMVEIGGPVLLVLLFDINPLVLTLMFGTYLLHEVTVYLDTKTAVKNNRKISLAEQHIHSFMEVMPFTTFSFIAILRWDQLQILLGQKSNKKAWLLHRKHTSPSARYLAAVIAAIGVFVALPYLEELQRCLKASTSLSKPE